MLALSVAGVGGQGGGKFSISLQALRLYNKFLEAELLNDFLHLFVYKTWE